MLDSVNLTRSSRNDFSLLGFNCTTVLNGGANFTVDHRGTAGGIEGFICQTVSLMLVSASKTPWAITFYWPQAFIMCTGFRMVNTLLQAFQD